MTRVHKISAAACGFVILISCTDEAEKAQWNALKGQMMGMSYAQVVQCAGVPDKDETSSSRSGSMSYLTRHTSVAQSQEPETNQCQANLTLVDGKVVSVSETALTGFHGTYECVNRLRSCKT